MKKLLALILTLCLLCGASALAEATVDGDTRTTDVSYVIEENKTFTVTIPSELSISADNNKGSMVFEIDAMNFNVRDYVVAVVLTGSTGYVESEDAFYLTNGDRTIPYELQRYDSPLTMTEPIMTWTCGHEEAPTKSTTVKAIAHPEGNLLAGRYSDTLTFTVMLIDLNNPDPGPNP